MGDCTGSPSLHRTVTRKRFSLYTAYLMDPIKRNNRYVTSSTAPRKSQGLVLTVQQQRISIDCGIFALAYIHSIGTKNVREICKFLL